MSLHSPRLEILAPAGGPEQLHAAVYAGADAVYLGAGTLNARRGATGFCREELEDGIRLCHRHGVAVHLALNTVTFDDDYEQARQIIAFACKNAVDAIIVQDIGLAAYIRASAPDMPLHASTQMSIHSLAGCRQAAEWGFSRVVLSRELSGEEIEYICAHSPIETEVFVHGALCMSVSGQCYMSAQLGQRSGNRGSCAQPCRLPFACGECTHALSLRDMSHIEHIPSMMQMGVASVKIEGRLKRAEYVAAAVTACRMMRDEGRVSEDILALLRAEFSRSGFTDGYFTARRGRTMFGLRTGEDAATSAHHAKAHELYKTPFQRVAVDFSLTAHTGKPLEMSITDGEHTLSLEGAVVQEAARTPLSREAACEKISRTGGTPCLVRTIDTDISEGCAVSFGELNRMRAQLVGQLLDKRAERAPLPCSFSSEGEKLPYRAEGKPHALSIVVRSASQLGKESIALLKRRANPCDIIYLPLEQCCCDDEDTLRLLDSDLTVGVQLPRAFFGQEDKIRSLLQSAAERGINHALAMNVAHIPLIREAQMALHIGFGLNTVSTATLCEFEKLGAVDCELSHEMERTQIKQLSASLPRGILAWGHIPAMLTRNCPARLSACREDRLCSLRDRRGECWPVRCSFGASEVFNPIALCIMDSFPHFAAADRIFLRFSVENSVETGEILSLMVDFLTPESNIAHTREYMLQKLKALGMRTTAGCFTRSVL